MVCLVTYDYSMTLCAVQTTFDINVFGTITLIKLVTPHMLKQGGGHFVVVRGD